VLAALLLGVHRPAIASHPRPAERCVPFSSHGRLMRGTSFRLRLPHGLEFILKADDDAWALVIRPIGADGVNFLDVTPPLQTRPHVYIGARYIDGRESVKFSRALEFVIRRRDYEAALAAINRDPRDAGLTLAALKALMPGRLYLTIADHNLAHRPEDSQSTETLEWIAFAGTVCVGS
jgi:hypothetical protein